MKFFQSKGFKIFVITAIIVLVGGWAYNTLMGNAEEVNRKIYTRDFSVAVPVKTATVKSEILEENQRYLGTFEVNREITLTSQTQGEVINIMVEEGDKLAKNGLVATVDAEQLNFQLIAAKAALQDATRDVERYTKLTDQNAIAKINLEKAQLQLATAESNVKVLEKQIKQTNIRAPFAGTLISKSFDLGSVLSPGLPLGQLVDISKLKLNINVPEENILNFKVGQKVIVKSDLYPTHDYPGTVSVVSEVADDAHKFEVQITIRNSSDFPLKSGMYGWIAHTQSSENQGNTIPLTALIGSAKDAKVFKVVDNKAVLQKVEIGMMTAESVQVISGLAAGDLVVTNGQINLTEGVEVSY